MKGKLKLKNVKKPTNNSGNNSEVSPNRSALREIILSIRKRDVSVSEKDRGTFFGDQTFIWRIFFIRGFQNDADLCISQSNWTYFSGFSIPLKDDSDVPDTPYSMPDSGFSEFDFGEENENNETPTSELLRKCRIARMESTLAKVREIEISYWGLHRCWWRMLETKFVGDKFEMLVTDSGCWWPI